jgi:hypothetical protein
MASAVVSAWISTPGIPSKHPDVSSVVCASRSEKRSDCSVQAPGETVWFNHTIFWEVVLPIPLGVHAT